MLASIQFSSVQSLSCVRLFATPWTTARQPSHPSPTTGVHTNPCPSSWWCHPTISSSVVLVSSCLQSFPASGSFLISQLFASVAKVLELQLQYQPFQWIFRTDFLYIERFDLLAVQGTLKSILQHHSSKASILRCSAFFMVQLSHPYVTTGKTIALTRRTFVVKVMSLLFNMPSRLVITLCINFIICYI